MRRLYLSYRFLRDLIELARHQRAWALMPLFVVLAVCATVVPLEKRWAQRPIVYAIF